MVRDYTLKLKVDAADLERSLKKALSSLKFNFGVSPGSSGTSSPAKDFSEGIKKISKDVNIYHHLNMKQKETLHKWDMEYRTHSALLARENQMLRQYGGPFSAMLGAIGGRPGSALGRLMDLKLKGQMGLDKEGKPNIPQFVKIAGFAAGLAGAAGLGKLIIDSSPMLQAMLKLLNVGIMFMLRPIGDFIGFLMRPLVIMLIKFAIPFYRAFGGPNAAKVAKALQEGDPAKATEILTQELKDFLASRQKDPTIGTNQKWLEEGLQSLLDRIIDELKQFTHDVHVFGEEGVQTPDIAFGGIGGAGQGTSAINTQQDILDAWIKAGAHVHIAGGTSSAGSEAGGGLQTKVTKGLSESVGISDEIKTKIITMQDRINEVLAKGVTYADGTKISTKKMQELFQDMADNDIVAMNDDMHGAMVEFEQIRKYGKLSTVTMTDMLNSILSAYKYFQDALNRASALKKSGGGATAVAKDARTISAALKATPPEETPHGWRFTYPDGSVLTFPINTVTQSMIKNAKEQGAKVVGFASGGILNEPVFGIGRSGKSYSFGEKGPERISPVGSSGGIGGGNFNATFNISGVSGIDDFENKLKPMVLKWFKESQSRRGIL